MEKYTAINIGPIISTLSMARKPRELWTASYMFSFFMECILNELKKIDGNAIISPAIDDGEKLPVGLYPDRVFVKGEVDANSVLQRAFNEFEKVIGIGSIKIDNEYINTMSVTISFDENQKDDKDSIYSSPIKMMNYLLDCAELSNRTIKSDAWQNVLNMIRRQEDSPLYACTGNKKMYIPMLGEIAACNVKAIIGDTKWKNLCNTYRNPLNLKDESGFYKEIKSLIGDNYKSYYKYVCVVQADGDRMGTIMSSLPVEKVRIVSKGLLKYCKAASRIIKNYGGFPIYAGGDDLLFLAPVVSGYAIDGNSSDERTEGKLNTIFDLLDMIDACYQKEVDNLLDDITIPVLKENEDRVHTAVSYGLSITYYKYPLYEALENARNLLFNKAKCVKGKNAVAWCLRKHSGSELSGIFTKYSSLNSVYSTFKDLMSYSVDNALVSAIAHKLRENEDLLEIILGKGESRLNAFYKKVMEADDNVDSYKNKTKRMLSVLHDEFNCVNQNKIAKMLEHMYGMLRTAKFINGEEDKDD